MRILITGGYGMLGSDLQQVLREDHEVFPMGHSECEITDEPALSAVFAKLKPELVINCAAYTDVDGCERDPERAMAVNGRGAGNVARAAERVGARVFHISTDYVFDGADRWDGLTVPVPERCREFIEQDATHPLSAYGKSKLEGEQQVLQGTARAAHLVIRTSWLYGLTRVNFVDRVMEQAQRGGPVKAVADQISCLTWTWDLAKAIGELVRRAARRGTPDQQISGVLHLAGSGMCTRMENARHIVDWLRLRSHAAAEPVEVLPLKWRELNLPARRPLFSAMTSARFAELGIAPLRNWREALDDYLALKSSQSGGRA